MSILPYPTLANPGETLFRQSVLGIASHDVTIQDQLDRAAWLHAAGHTSSAHLLFAVAALRFGIADSSLRWLAVSAERLGYRLRRVTPAPRPCAEPAFAVDLAVDELARVLPLMVKASACVAAPVQVPAASRPNAKCAALLDMQLDAFFAYVEPGLMALLEETGRSKRLGVASFRTLVADAVADLTPFDPVRSTDARVGYLAKFVAFNDLHRFLLDSGGLAEAPFGSPALLDASACFEPTALGPYFSNVERLLRDMDDLFALIRLASRDATEEVDVAGWCVLLSTRFSSSAQRELATSLFRRGLLDGLRGMIARVDKRAVVLDRKFLWHVRDLGLTYDHVEIARDCQAVLARHAVTDSVEWVILADLCAIINETAGVEASLARALAISPDDPEAKARLVALQAGTADEYARTNGFLGSPERVHLPLRRRSSLG